MNSWQRLVILVLLVALGWAIVAHPPGSYVVRTTHKPLTTLSPKAVAQDSPVTLLFVGDIMLSRSVGDMMLARNDWTWPFAKIASATSAADLTFGNLETTISTRSVANGCGFCFRADPRSLQGLHLAGFDVLSIANNHIWDYGRVAFEDTMTHLASRGMSFVGGGWTLTEARGPLIREVRGTKIAYLASTDILPASAQATDTSAGANRYDAQRIAEDITRAQTLADVVVVSFHGGTEYEPYHNPTQERIYHAAIDSGADLVIGHHPHVVQDIERYKGKWIVYSLGNFIFDQNWSVETRKGMLVDVVVEHGVIASLATRSVDISTQYQASLRGGN